MQRGIVRLRLVFGQDPWRIRPKRRVKAYHRRERLVLDEDLGGTVGGGPSGVGDDRGHRLANVEHPVPGQGAVRAGRVNRTQISGREHRVYAWNGDGDRRVDADDASGRMLA